MFKHNLGCLARTKVTTLTGILVSRSENLYGCNRYYIQPKATDDHKVPEGRWVDEDDISIITRRH